MTRYGIADIGSNTVVLLAYEAAGSTLRNLKYISTPAHLIDDVKDGVMSAEGIRKASEILKGYAAILDSMEIEYRFADVTEPCRIDNKDELVAALEESRKPNATSGALKSLIPMCMKASRLMSAAVRRN